MERKTQRLKTSVRQIDKKLLFSRRPILGAARVIRLLAGNGLSEPCPVVALGQAKPSLSKPDPEAQADLLCRATLLTPFVRARIVDGQGRTLPRGREQIGELLLQGPWLTQGHYKAPEQSRQLWRDDWPHTGDVATLNPEGYLRITDRIKDVIKIGGEWISSLELENALNQHRRSVRLE